MVILVSLMLGAYFVGLVEMLIEDAFLSLLVMLLFSLSWGKGFEGFASRVVRK